MRCFEATPRPQDTVRYGTRDRFPNARYQRRVNDSLRKTQECRRTTGVAVLGYREQARWSWAISPRAECATELMLERAERRDAHAVRWTEWKHVVPEETCVESGIVDSCSD